MDEPCAICGKWSTPEIYDLGNIVRYLIETNEEFALDVVGFLSNYQICFKTS